jgi:hypothetical protein
VREALAELCRLKYVDWRGAGGKREGTCVDDLEALFQKRFSFFGKMVPNTALRCVVGLVNVNSACRASKLATDVADIGGCAANGVVEDKNSRCSCAV